MHDETIRRASLYSSIAVTDESPLVASSIAFALSAQGRHVTLTSSPAAPIEELIVTAGLSSGSAHDVHWKVMSQAQAFQRAGGKSLILLQDSGGSFTGGGSRGWYGGIAALARTAALEWPAMAVRCIDVAVDRDDIPGTTHRLLTALDTQLAVVGVDLAGQLYRLQTGPQEPRSVREFSAKNPATGVTNTRKAAKAPVESSVWLVSGGARGVTAACIEQLAREHPANFALLGRSRPTQWPTGIALTHDIRELRRSLAASAIASGRRPVPRDIERAARQALAGQEIRDALADLQAAGVTARYFACDIADPQQVNMVVRQIQEELGRVTALVHGAGVLADSLLVDKTRSEFDRVFNTKVGGLQNLLSALGAEPLAHVALFSSAAAFYGNTGQSDYAMANEVLNRVARSLTLCWPDAVVKSFNWGPWESGMVDQTLARLFEERGIRLIPVKEGANVFVDEMLGGDQSRIELLIGDPWLSDTSAATASSQASSGPLEW